MRITTDLDDSYSFDCIFDLQALREKYPDRLQIRPMEVLFLEKITEQSTVNGVTLRSMLGLPPDFAGYDWTDDPPFKVIVTLTKVTEKTFFRRIFKELVLQDGFFSIGRPQIFTFVTGYQYHLLLPESKITGGSSFNSLFAQTFFDIKCLGKFDWSNFHPPAKLPKKVSLIFHGRFSFNFCCICKFIIYFQ